MNRTVTADTTTSTGTTPRWLPDGVIAVVVAALQVAGTYGAAYHSGISASPIEYAAGALAGLVLVVRRRFPVPVLVVTAVLSVGCWALASVQSPIFLSDIVAFVTVIMARKRAAAVIALVCYYVGYQWLPVLTGVRPAPSALAAVLAAAGLVVLLGAAELLRLRQQRTAAIAASRQDQALRRASEERLRIARDLHDVVAHNISVINVQANTALHLMHRQPERAEQALTTIHEVSKQALVELRSVLGVLRDVDHEAPRTPVPGLGDLDALLERSRAAGLVVHMFEEGERRPLPTDVDVTAYRIVQESLTNSSRHSGGGRAIVRLSYGESELCVEVDDDGPSLRSSRTNGSGKGITGMLERAQALGGTLQAGPRPGGGFLVRAHLPLNGECR